MKAWVLHGANDIRLENIPKPIPASGEVLVRVKAAGICSSDIPRVYANGAYFYPIILGHEFSGVTENGRRVGVFPLLPCHKCESCLSRHYETCSAYGYIGSRQNGAFAEYVAVPQWNLFELADNVTFEQAALLEPAAVALHAVKSVKDFGISKAAVVGSGVVGELTGAWLSRYGVQFVDVLGRNDKGMFQEYDLCVEAAGTVNSLERCIELVKPNGEIVLLGNPEMEFSINRKIYWQLLRKQIAVRGCWNSSYPADWKRTLDFLSEIQLGSFVSHVFNFDELNNALNMMHSKSKKHKKVMIRL
ncbi:MAG: alcohol dehydrogenase catalytic domain-containing protein [Clostridiales bacterium]|nr:alcohol dehydrogenase catalytic domain-containing protein [Clostridiales bacterium]